MAGSTLIEIMRNEAKRLVPKTFLIATVVQCSPNPLIIKLDDSDINIESDFLLTSYGLSVSVEDKVLLCEIESGQKFVVLCKVVDAT